MVINHRASPHNNEVNGGGNVYLYSVLDCKHAYAFMNSKCGESAAKHNNTNNNDEEEKKQNKTKEMKA